MNEFPTGCVRRFPVECCSVSTPEKKSALSRSRHAADVSDVLAGDIDIASFLAEAASVAVRTHRVSTVPAQEYADVELVFLCFQICKEVADGIQNEVHLIRIQFPDRGIQRDSLSPSGLLEIVEIRAISRLRPRFDGALVERETPVGNHQVQVEIDRIAESLAARTCAKRIVEREKPWLGIFIADIAGLALKRFAEAVSLAPRNLEQDFSTVFAKTDFDRIDQPLAHVG